MKKEVPDDLLSGLWREYEMSDPPNFHIIYGFEIEDLRRYTFFLKRKYIDISVQLILDDIFMIILFI